MRGYPVFRVPTVSPTFKELRIRIVVLYAPREERRAEVAGTVVVATSETFEDALREAEQTEEELNIKVVVPPARPIPVEVHANVVPNHTWSYVGDHNNTMAVVVAQSTEVPPQIYKPPPLRSSQLNSNQRIYLPPLSWVRSPQLRSSVGLSPPLWRPSPSRQLLEKRRYSTLT
jgi:hypothetical protein